MPAAGTLLRHPVAAGVEAGKGGGDSLANLPAGLRVDAVARFPGIFDDALELFCLHWGPAGLALASAPKAYPGAQRKMREGRRPVNDRRADDRARAGEATDCHDRKSTRLNSR